MTPVLRNRSILTRARHVINALLLVVFSAVWMRDVIYWLPKDAHETSLNYWAYTDWLVDYSQGFIRRGLSGEIWRLVPETVPPLQFVATFSWVLILVVVFGYVRLLVRSWKIYHPLTLFGLLFLPSLFIFYIHDHNAIARKEILGYVTLLLHLLVIEKSLPRGDGSVLPEANLRLYMRWMIPVAVVVLPAIILIHEGNFLVFVPLHGILTMSILRIKFPRQFWQAALITGLFCLPAGIAFGAVYLSGTPNHEMLLGICEKWLAAGALREVSCVLPPERLSGSTLPGSFIPMEWSMREAVSITQMIIEMNWKSWLLILLTLGISLWYLVRQAIYGTLLSLSPQVFFPKMASHYTVVFCVKYFFIPLLFSLPVYFTAYDYGRWFSVTCINFAMVAASMNLPWWEFSLLKQEAGDGVPATDTQAHLDHPLVFYFVSAIICFLVLVLWLPHYCLFSCDILQSPLQFFSHNFIAN